MAKKERKLEERVKLIVRDECRHFINAVIKPHLNGLHLQIDQLTQKISGFEDLPIINENFFSDMKQYLIHIRDTEQAIYEQLKKISDTNGKRINRKFTEEDVNLDFLNG